jgi:hypothetical protein
MGVVGGISERLYFQQGQEYNIFMAVESIDSSYIPLPPPPPEANTPRQDAPPPQETPPPEAENLERSVDIFA